MVLITGCSSGIGRDLARRLGGAGYRVVATDCPARPVTKAPRRRDVGARYREEER
ncbi:MAG TPA: SDR family NAD(P)-dependent oxidoreductase [Symbiobacteriaceae bacterium]